MTSPPDTEYPTVMMCQNCVELPLADNVSTIRDEKQKRPP